MQRILSIAIALAVYAHPAAAAPVDRHEPKAPPVGDQPSAAQTQQAATAWLTALGKSEVAQATIAVGLPFQLGGHGNTPDAWQCAKKAAAKDAKSAATLMKCLTESLFGHALEMQFAWSAARFKKETDNDREAIVWLDDAAVRKSDLFKKFGKVIKGMDASKTRWTGLTVGVPASATFDAILAVDPGAQGLAVTALFVDAQIYE